MSRGQKVKIGDVKGSVVVVGDGNAVGPGATVAPQAVAVEELLAAVAGMRSVLEVHAETDQPKVLRALDDIEDDLRSDKPEEEKRAGVGEAMKRASTIVKRSTGFAGDVTKLQAHADKLGLWLGETIPFLPI
ncbi:MAG: hypothetical protein AAF533_22445 [Acidobacteriota bacterium]